MTSPSKSKVICLELCVVCINVLCAGLIGCGLGSPANAPVSGSRLRGNIHGGQQPVSGASIQLYAAGNTGYGSGSTAPLTTPVFSDANGNFTITGDYTCPASSSLLYLVATGGNPGLASGTSNHSLALMAAVGGCVSNGSAYTLDPNSFININEVTTVAAVYALNGFMTDGTVQVGSSSTNAKGIANAFLSVANLVNNATGSALAVTPAGNGKAPQAVINTLADILAPCIDSDGTGTACSSLFAATTIAGGSAPADTLQAALHIASHPANQVNALYALVAANAPFQPTLSAAPNDWTVGVNYSGNFSNAVAIAIDAAGDVWVVNNGLTVGGGSVTKLSNNGTVLSGAAGFTAGGISFPSSIAIDLEGNAWVPSYDNDTIVKFSNDGAVLSGANGFTGLNSPRAVAIDGSDNVWTANYGEVLAGNIIKQSNAGVMLSGANGYVAGGATTPSTIAIDASGDAWTANGGDRTVTELGNDGTVLSGSSGYVLGPNIVPNAVAIDAQGNAWTDNSNDLGKVSSGGQILSGPSGFVLCTPTSAVYPALNCSISAGGGIAIDGSGNVWVPTANFLTDSQGHIIRKNHGLGEADNNGNVLSGATGYTGGLLNLPNSVAIDSSGAVWAVNAQNSSSVVTVTQLVGAATPVVTPLAVGVRNHTLGTRP